MIQTAQDAYERMRTRLGKLARRRGTTLTTPSEADEDALSQYLDDALGEIGTETDRLTKSLTIDTTQGQEYVEKPPHLDLIKTASVQTGTEAWTAEVEDGQDIAQWARNPSAKAGRPEHIGAYDLRLYLFPVPDAVYTLDLNITMNGATSENDSTPSPPADPPTLDEVVKRVPSEFERALTSYLVGRWLEDIGQSELSQMEMERFAVELQKHMNEPVSSSTSQIPHNTLG